MSAYLYEPADTIKPGDVLPGVSRHAVTGVVVFPHESVRVSFGHGAYILHFPYGGPDFGYPAVRIERAEPLCDCGHAHDRHDETGHCTARGDYWRCAC